MRTGKSAGRPIDCVQNEQDAEPLTTRAVHPPEVPLNDTEPSLMRSPLAATTFVPTVSDQSRAIGVQRRQGCGAESGVSVVVATREPGTGFGFTTVLAVAELFSVLASRVADVIAAELA